MYKLLTAVALAIGVCHGDSTVTLQFTQLPSVQLNYDYSTGGTYNGYAMVTIGGIPAQNLICDDYADETYVPSGPLVFDYSTFTDPTPLQYARFTGPNQIVTYQTAAVLMANFSALVNPSADTVTDYQYALWNLFNPSAPANPAQQALQNTAQGLVLSNSAEANFDYAHLVIYTPTEAIASNQEFLGVDTPVGAPEPAFWPVIALAIAGAISIRRGRS